MTSESDEFVVECRGLPWSCTDTEIKQFFEGAADEITDILFCLNPAGRPSGIAYVTFSTKKAMDRSFEKHRKFMGDGTRYIEVFASSPSKRNEAIKKNSMCGNEDWVVRLRGLPYQSTSNHVVQFFAEGGVPMNAASVWLEQNRLGRLTGDAYVQFTNADDTNKALLMDRQYIGRRYIGVIRSSADEMIRAQRRMNARLNARRDIPSYDGVIEDGVIRMRGLPYQATKHDIKKFFGDLIHIDDNQILLVEQPLGVPTGDAYVRFNTGDVRAALMKHRNFMGKRYVEVFVSSSDEMSHVRHRMHSSDDQGAPRRRDERDGPGQGGGSGGLEPDAPARSLGAADGGINKAEHVKYMIGETLAPKNIGFTARWRNPMKV